MFSLISRFCFAGVGGQFLLRGDHRLDGFLAEFERGIEVGFGDFLGRAFKHDEVVFVADIDEVEIALRHLSVRRVGDELAIDAADANRAQRAVPGNIADHQRRGSADDARAYPDRFRRRR